MRKKIGLVDAVLATLLVASSCSRGRPTDARVTVGAVLPLSGPAAFVGENTLRGLQLAEDHANQGRFGKLSFRLRILAEDGGATPKGSISAFQKLVGVNGARYVVTTTSGASMALKPLADPGGVLLFANASHPRITDGTSLVLRHSNTAGQEAVIIARDITTTTPHAKTTLLVQNDDYGLAFAESMRRELQQGGAAEIDQVTFEPRNLDARTVALRALSASPTSIVALGTGKGLGLLLRQVREFGFSGTLYAGLGYVLVPGAAEAAGPAAVTIRHTEFDIGGSNPLFVALSTEYHKRFNRDLGAEGIVGYNTIKLLVEGISRTDGSPAAVARWIKAARSFHGVGEEMEISGNGDITMAIRLAAAGS